MKSNYFYSANKAFLKSVAGKTRSTDTKMIIFIDLARFFIRRPYPMRPALVNLLGSVAIALRKRK